MPEAAPSNIAEWTVSELSSALKRTVEDAYGYVRVRGEISGFKGASPSGHCYFRLKDDKAVLEGVIWKGNFARMRVKPEEGLDVIVTGKLTTFPGSSKYQIVIDSLEPAGVGALMLYSVANSSWSPWADAHLIRFGICFVIMLALAMVEGALAAAHAPEIEAQHGKAALRKGVIHVVDDLIVHRATKLGVGMKNDRDGRAALLGGVKAAFETSGRAGEDDFGHRIST